MGRRKNNIYYEVNVFSNCRKLGEPLATHKCESMIEMEEITGLKRCQLYNIKKGSVMKTNYSIIEKEIE